MTRRVFFLVTTILTLALAGGSPALLSNGQTIAGLEIFSPARADGAGSTQIVANVGYDRHAAVGQTLQLDASGSLSMQGRPLAYSWKAVKLPSGSKARLSASNIVRPTVTLDVAGDYVFAVAVGPQGQWWGGVLSQAQVTISTTNVAPVANAGLNRVVAQGASVALDGARSFDADGDAIAYAWTLASKPRGSRAALSSATAVRPTLTLDAAGAYVAQLVVTDSKGKSSRASFVTISTGRHGVLGRASAGPAQLVAQGAQARLDADGTYLPSGAPTNAGFALLSAPAGSAAKLAAGPDARSAFTLDLSGDYVVQTTISASSGSGDGAGREDDDDQSGALAATALVTTGNVAPVAFAGDDQKIVAGASVTLDGSRSTDANGDPLIYSWSLIQIPAGSKAALDNASAVQPKFTADVAGDYVAQLIVADGFGAATPSTVVVSTRSVKPLVDAGPDVFARTGTAVLLDGSHSSDPAGGALAPQWTILGLGDQLTGTLTAPNALQTNFNIPAAGVPLNQAVLAGPAALPLPGQHCRGEDDDHSIRLYSAGRLTNLGVPYTIWQISNYGENSAAVTLAAVSASFSDPLSVPARSDLFVASPVVAGSAAHELIIAGWTGYPVEALASTFADTRLVGGGPPLELSIVQLIASNATLFDYDDTVVSTVEARPLAALNVSNPAYRGAAVTLDGSQSQNPNNPAAPTTGLSYSWSLLSRPAGSKASIANASAALTGFTPDAYGLYVAQLIVSDGKLASRPKTVVVNVAPRPPVAAIKAASPVVVARTELLDGSSSTDPDGNPLTYAWTLTVPAGSKATLGNPSAASPSFVPDVVGTYVAQLVVSDAYGKSTPASASIVAQGGFAFTSNPGAQTVALGSSVSFQIQASDPKNNPIVYSVVGALPQGASFNTTTGAFSFRPASNDPASLTLTFQASNGQTTISQNAQISITGQPSGTVGALSATVYDAADYAKGVLTPVSNVVVSSGSASGTSGSGGQVSVAGLAAGQDTLIVSAAGAPPAPDGSAYVDAAVSANIIAGVVNTLDSPILLARASGGGSINPTGPTTVSNPDLGVTLTIAQGSAFGSNGQPYTGAISIGSLPSNTPVALPPGFSPCQLLVISPVGVTFNPPAQLTVANADQLPPGAYVDLWAFDAQLGYSRIVSIGQVSADGKTITTTIGGVPGGTILTMAPRGAGLTAIATQPQNVFSPSVLGGGDLSTSFAPPGIRELNKGRAFNFVYHSATANPNVVIDAAAKLAPNLGLPQSLTTQLTVGGATQATVLNTNLSKPLAGGSALNGGQQNSVLQAGVVNASSLTSGTYPYSFLTLSKYACSTVGSQLKGSVTVNNQSGSAFGAGWTLAELQKLNKNADGTVSIAEGSGRVVTMSPQQSPSFLPDPIYIPVNGPFLGAVADLTGDGRPSLLKLGWKDGSLNVILNRGNRQLIKTATTIIGDAGVQNADGTLSVDVHDVAVGDVTGDGVNDAVYLNSNHNEAKILVGSRGGTFQPVPIAVESNGPGGGVVTGDFIGDGFGGVMMSENQGGWPDVHIIYNDGKNNFTFHRDAPILPAANYMHVKVRLPGFQHDTVAVLTADGSLSFTYGGNTDGGLRDGHWTRGPSNLGYWQVDDDEMVIDSVRMPTSLAPFKPSRVLATGDIDGTGVPSFAVATATAIYIVKWNGPGAGNQQVVQTLTLPGGLAPDSVTLAPLAKGNRPSVIATTNTAGFYVFLNDGKGNFTSQPTLIQTPFRVAIEANVVDFDGDGVADVALNDIDNDRVAIFFGSANNTSAFVSPIGDYTRLVQNPDGSYSRVYNDGSVVTFDKNGFQSAIRDANGNTTNYSFNGQGQLTTIVGPTGSTTSMSYAGAWVSSVTDSVGRTTSFQHDGAGNLTQVTDPMGNVTQYLYDANHQLVSTISPTGGTTTNSYNSTGQITKQTYPDGASVTLDVSKALGLDALGVSLGGPANAAFVPLEQRDTLLQDGNGNLSEQGVNEWGAVVQTTDALGRVSNFSRDGANRVVHSETPAGTSTGQTGTTPGGLAQNGSSDLLVNDYIWDASGNLLSLHEANGHAPQPGTNSPVDRVTAWAYEPVHNKVVQKTDADGFVTKWNYDANGNLLAMTDALGNVTSFAYDARGLQLSKTDPLGHATSYGYDNSGNQNKTTDAAGTAFLRYYDGVGNVIQSVDAAGTNLQRARTTYYDANNRVIKTVSATGETTQSAYDANGNLGQFTDAAGNVTTSVYDTMNRLVSTTTPDSGTRTFTYDNNNNQLTETDAAGATTSYVYDAGNRLIATTDATAATRTTGYDLRNNAVTVTDARGNTNAFAYDVLKRLASRTTPNHDGVQPFLYAYDRRDNLTGAASPAWENQAIGYDGLSRLVSDGYRSLAYDAAGNLTGISGENGLSLAYAYDALNRRVGEVVGGYANPFSLAYGYDALSRRVTMADNYGAATSYAYDAEDRLTTITTPWGLPITQSYDAAGRPLRLAYPNGLDADLSFENGTGRLAGILHRAGSLATPIAQFLHSYDARGDLATLTERNKAKSFVYDKIERLIDVMQTSVAAPVESYAYDTEGNRTASHLSPGYVTDPANRVLDDGTNSYSWSPNGAMTSRTPKAGGGGLSFQNSWHGLDNQVRLDAISGAFPMRFSYDPQGRMAARAFDYEPSLGVQDRYHDGEDMVLELRNRGGAAPQWVRYIHGASVDQPLALEIYPAGAPPTPGTGSQYYYHADGEGSIRLLTDANGQTANQYEYDSYGQRLTAVESAPQPFAWKGREWVPGPDLYFNRARFYDPQLGRFTSEDPLGYDGGDSNFYSFAWSNPKNWNDPSGLSATETAGIDSSTTGAILGGGTVAVDGGVIQSGTQAASVIARTSSPVQKIGAEVACALFRVASALDFAFSAPAGSIPVPVGCGVVAADPESTSRTIPDPPMPKRGCTAICRADANDNIVGNINEGDQTFAFGEATAPTCAQAVKEAKRAATHKLGKQPKHVGCKTAER